jgi:hypothetical protein
MGNFIVGGFLPGTNVQLSFKAWLIATASVAAVFYLLRFTYKHTFNMSMTLDSAMRGIAPSSHDLHMPLSFKTPVRYRTSALQAVNAVSSSWLSSKVRSIALDIYLSDWTYHQD